MAQAASPIVIAVAGPMSDDLARFGTQMKEGAERAVTEINAHGGVLGRPLKLVVEDDRCQRDHATAVAEDAADDGAVFVVGHFCSGSSIPASEVYHEHNILMITPASSNPRLTDDAASKGWRTVFRVYGRDDRQAEFAGAEIARKFAGKKVAIIGDQSTSGGMLLSAVRRSMTQAGLQPALVDTVAADQPNYADLIHQLKIKGIQVLYYAGDSQAAGEIIKEARAEGLSLQLLGSDAFYTDDFLRAAGPAAEGTMFTAEADANPSAPANETHDSAVRSYAAVQLWAAAVAKAGTTDANKVADVLRAGSWNTVLGPVSFDAKGDPVKPDYAWYLVKQHKISEMTH
jgi:branched-chain amino acid transport system substrate-binding protein